MNLSRLVLDVAKPVGEYSIIDLAKDLSRHVRNGNVFIKVDEIDIQTEGLKVIIEGKKISFEGIRTALSDRGAVINSLDEATITSNGKKK